MMSGEGQMFSVYAKNHMYHPVIGGPCVEIGNSYSWPIWGFFLSIGDDVDGI